MYARWGLAQLALEVEEAAARVRERVMMVMRMGMMTADQTMLDGRRLQQALQHAARATVLQTLVRCQRVLGAISPVAELAYVQRVGLLVLVLKVPLQRVVAGECASTVGALLRLINPATGWRRHAQRHWWHWHNTNTDTNAHTHAHTPIARLRRGGCVVEVSTGIDIGWTNIIAMTVAVHVGI